MVITDFDKKLFRIIHIIRCPKAGDNWTRYNMETKWMTMIFLKERTSMSSSEITKLFGMKTPSNLLRVSKFRIDEETYKMFLKQILDLMY